MHRRIHMNEVGFSESEGVFFLALEVDASTGRTTVPSSQTSNTSILRPP